MKFLFASDIHGDLHAAKQVLCAYDREGADRLVLLARMTFVGRSSCEVRVDSYIEDKEGFRHTINRAFLTYVAIDENGTPIRFRLANNFSTKGLAAFYEEKHGSMKEMFELEGDTFTIEHNYG
jgi:Icc-related predicted phosphoesterase